MITEVQYVRYFLPHITSSCVCKFQITTFKSWVGVASDGLKLKKIISKAVETASIWDKRTNRHGFPFVSFILINNSEGDSQCVLQT
jgi:hypothetical protein